MKKTFLQIVFTFFCLFCFFGAGLENHKYIENLFEAELVPYENESVVYVASCDWGACVEKIIINTEKTFSEEQLKLSDFEVHRYRKTKDTDFAVPGGELILKDAFISDEKGNPLKNSHFITVLCDVHPLAENSSPFVTGKIPLKFHPLFSYVVENDELDIKVKKVRGYVNENASKFALSKFDYVIGQSEGESEKITMNYAAFVPEKRLEPDKKIPLILWFHGMGESGTNIYDVLFGTKSSALAGQKIQKHFTDGAAILAPQCARSWLETTEKAGDGPRVWAPVDKDGVEKKIKKPLKILNDMFTLDKGVKANEPPEVEEESSEPDTDSEKAEKIPFASVSYYTEPVLALLEDFLSSHPEIDRNRIYAGGCSAGGYMTMNMVIQMPEIFAAAFPICEFYLDSKITDSQVGALSKMPLWFTYALNDETVKPKNCSIPTIRRLKNAGAENLHVSEFKNVADTSKTYLLKPDAEEDDSEFGLFYEYDGHSSWIYVLNDECFDGELNLFDWLSEQSLQ